MRFLARHGVPVRFGRLLRALELQQDRVAGLDFGEERIALDAADGLILAVPPVVAGELVPGLAVPREYRAIVNAHFRIEAPPALAPMTGIINGLSEWLFVFPGRLAVTISAADRLLEVPREELAQTIWGEIAAVAALPKPLPPWQIVRERRATFAATPAENARRPAAETRWRNLVLAGDWIRTGLPATIEGAIRSGNRAADLVASVEWGMR
jgi:hypothetical protein